MTTLTDEDISDSGTWFTLLPSYRCLNWGCCYCNLAVAIIDVAACCCCVIFVIVGIVFVMVTAAASTVVTIILLLLFLLLLLWQHWLTRMAAARCLRVSLLLSLLSLLSILAMILRWLTIVWEGTGLSAWLEDKVRGERSDRGDDRTRARMWYGRTACVLQCWLLDTLGCIWSANDVVIWLEQKEWRACWIGSTNSFRSSAKYTKGGCSDWRGTLEWIAAGLATETWIQ